MRGMTGPDWNAVASHQAGHGMTWTLDPRYAGSGLLAARLPGFAQEVPAGRVFQAWPARPHIAAI